MIRTLNHIAVRELQYEVAVHDESIHTFGIDPHLRAGAMPAVTQGLDHQWCTGEAEVHANQPVTPSTENLLRNGTDKVGRIEQSQELAFEPTVRATNDLDPLDHGQQRRNPMATPAAKCADASMEKVLRYQPIAQRAIERRRQRVSGSDSRKVDQGAGRRGHRESSDRFAVEALELLRRVDDNANTPDVAVTMCYQVIWRCQSKGVEVLQCGSGRAAEPARPTDIGDQRRERGMVVYYWEAALDPASKLWGELTVDDRRAAALSGHAPDSIAERAHATTFGALCERSEARKF